VTIKSGTIFAGLFLFLNFLPVKFLVYVVQAGISHVSVYLSGYNRTVAEKGL